MSKNRKLTIAVQGASVTVLSQNQQDIICLTDIAKYKNPDHPDDVIRNWLRNRNTVEFLGVWERLNNPAFNPVEFDGIRMQTGLNSFVLTSKQWIEKTGAVGLTSRAGRYGGTYAHKDIAFEFAAWVSVEFKLNAFRKFGARPVPYGTTERPMVLQSQRDCVLQPSNRVDCQGCSSSL